MRRPRTSTIEIVLFKVLRNTFKFHEIKKTITFSIIYFRQPFYVGQIDLNYFQHTHLSSTSVRTLKTHYNVLCRLLWILCVKNLNSVLKNISKKRNSSENI